MRINIELPEELHTALKVRAAVEGITLKQLIINILKTDLWLFYQTITKHPSQAAEDTQNALRAKPFSDF